MLRVGLTQAHPNYHHIIVNTLYLLTLPTPHPLPITNNHTYIHTHVHNSWLTCRKVPSSKVSKCCSDDGVLSLNLFSNLFCIALNCCACCSTAIRYCSLSTLNCTITTISTHHVTTLLLLLHCLIALAVQFSYYYPPATLTYCITLK